MRPLVCLTVLMALLTAVPAPAASVDSVSIISDSLQLQEKSGDIRFEGHVEVKVSGIVLRCDLLTVRSGGGSSSQVTSGKASGSVVLTRGNDTVEAEEALFDLEAGRVVLTGQPRLTRGGTTIEALQISYLIEEGTASFQGPVKAHFKAPGE